MNRSVALLIVLAVFAGALSAATGVPPRDPVRVDEQSEAIIGGAMRYLASKQLPNGSWGISSDEKKHPVAIAGYVLLAFQAAGQLPGEGEHGRTVTAGMDYLLNSTAPDGVIGNRSDGQYMYGHGIASIALAELYGQTRSPAMRVKLERVIKLIIACQNNEGGWRYRPIVRDADISVTVLQVVALRAAKNAGLDVPQETIDRAIGYVKRCYDKGSGGFNYQPGREPGFARTAAAIYSLQVCGLYDDPMVGTGSDYLIGQSGTRQEWFTYGHFYAAPAQYMVGGETWNDWYLKVSEKILHYVNTDGGMSWWDGTGLDRGGKGGVGPIYSTAVYTMILAMPFHYLPLYQR